MQASRTRRWLLAICWMAVASPLPAQTRPPFSFDRLESVLFDPGSDDSACSVSPNYIGEVLSNTRGGISTRNATQYQGLLSLPVTIDLERLRTPLPGRVSLLGQNTHGRGLTNDFVGDTLVVSNFDAGRNITQVSTYWWESPQLGDAVRLRLGKQDLNTEFLFLDQATDFVNSSFGLSPNEFLPSYPNPSMAAVALVDLDDSKRLKVGVWDALASGGTWGFSGNDTTISIIQFERDHVLAGDLPGTIEVAYIHFSGGDAFGTSLPAFHGFCLQAEQYVYREPGCSGDTPQGLVLLGSCRPRAEGENVIPIPAGIDDALVLGAVYRGPLHGRDDDVFGLGYAIATLNQPGPDTESVWELFYDCRVTDQVAIQPDLQYVVTPSGIRPDSLVVGVRFTVAFQ